jgi:hypothetical protein
MNAKGIACFLAIVTAVGTGATQSHPLVHYPKNDGVVFALPHVSIILNALTPRQRKGLRLSVDGQRVPDEAIAGCPICAGDRPTVIAAKARWTITDGVHRLVATVNGDELPMLRYTLDSTTPSLSGLTGMVDLPDAFVAIAPTVRMGAMALSRSPRYRFWLGVTGGKRLPSEIAILHSLRPHETSVVWKFAPLRHRHWGVSVGQWDGDAFAAIGYRTQPSYFVVSIGVGRGDLPSAWLSFSYSLSHLTTRLKFSERARDFFAVLDLVRLQAEVDSRGRWRFGALLCHPYGWRVGIFRSHQLNGQTAWGGQFSFSQAWR